METTAFGFRESLLIGAAIAMIAAIVALVLVWVASRGSGFKPALHGGVAVIGSDTGAGQSILLTDPVIGLRGRPDYLLDEGTGSDRLLVPLEVKPTRRSNRLYESDAVQLGAYLIASRATFGSEAADFGYVRYSESSFRVQLSPHLERRVREIIAGIRTGRSLRLVRRTHGIRPRCAACAMRARCDDALR